MSTTLAASRSVVDTAQRGSLRNDATCSLHTRAVCQVEPTLNALPIRPVLNMKAGTERDHFQKLLPVLEAGHVPLDSVNMSRRYRWRTPIGKRLGVGPLPAQDVTIWISCATLVGLDLEAHGHLAPSRLPPADLATLVAEGRR